MQCIAITKGQERCRKSARFLLCSAHRKHPLTIVLSLLAALGLASGIYRDLIEPMLPSDPASDVAVADSNLVLEEVRIPIELESTWDTDTRLDPSARIFLTQPGDDETEKVVYSAVARVEVPDKGATQNGDIWIPSYSTTNTFAVLPKAPPLIAALENGGYSLRIVLQNKHGHTFTHSKTILFDKQAVLTPVHFWLRLDFEQIPR